MCANSSLSWLKSVRHLCPMFSSNTFDSGWLARANQRRGVTPLVLLQKRFGNRRAKSANSDCTISSECSSDTPFTLWLAITANHAIRTRRPLVSSIIETRDSNASSLGYCSFTSFRKWSLIWKISCRWRGKILPNMSTGHVSRASLINVWLV